MSEGADLITSRVMWDHEWPAEACRFSFPVKLFRRCRLVFFRHVSHLGRRVLMVTAQLVLVTVCFLASHMTLQFTRSPLLISEFEGSSFNH